MENKIKAIIQLKKNMFPEHRIVFMNFCDFQLSQSPDFQRILIQ